MLPIGQNRRYNLENLTQLSQILCFCCAKFSVKDFNSYGYDNDFAKANVFPNVQNIKNKYLRKNGHNGIFSEHITFKIRYGFSILTSYM